MQGSEENENIPAIKYIVDTVQTNGVVPQVGDVTVSGRYGGLFGSLVAVRVLGVGVNDLGITHAIEDVVTTNSQ